MFAKLSSSASSFDVPMGVRKCRTHIVSFSIPTVFSPMTPRVAVFRSSATFKDGSGLGWPNCQLRNTHCARNLIPDIPHRPVQVRLLATVVLSTHGHPNIYNVDRGFLVCHGLDGFASEGRQSFLAYANYPHGFENGVISLSNTTRTLALQRPGDVDCQADAV
jgi:hypothetical protein